MAALLSYPNGPEHDCHAIHDKLQVFGSRGRRPVFVLCSCVWCVCLGTHSLCVWVSDIGVGDQCVWIHGVKMGAALLSYPNGPGHDCHSIQHKLQGVGLGFGVSGLRISAWKLSALSGLGVG